MKTPLQKAPEKVQWAIHSFHINIGTGDSSIHLLVDKAPDIPQIWRACLIDGGKGGKGELAKDRIIDVINFINSEKGHVPIGKTLNYSFADDQLFGDPGPKKLKFDSVVITHWDNDHYKGVWELLEESMSDDIKKYDLGKNPGTNYKKSTWCIGGYRCKYFKYAKKESIPTTEKVFKEKKEWTVKGDNPRAAAKFTGSTTLSKWLDNTILSDHLQTTLYVPYIVGGEREPQSASASSNPQTATKKAKAKSSPVNTDENSIGGRSLSHPYSPDSDTWSRPWMFSNDYSKYVKGRVNTAGFMVMPEIIKSERVRSKYWFYRQCLLKACHDDYLGLELFDNTSPGTGIAWSEVSSPNVLIYNHGLFTKHGPRMFIVAGDQFILGDTKLASVSATRSGIPPAIPFNSNQLVTNTHPVLRIVNKKLEPADGKDKSQRWSGVRQGSEPKNSASIVIVILSSTITTRFLGGVPSQPCFKMWHYTGGDALWDVEAALCDWFLGSTTPDANWKRAVRSATMKLSHHGGISSTPSNLLEALKPKFLVCPSHDQHGHPRPEIVLYLIAINDKETGQGNKIEMLLYNKPSWWFPSPNSVRLAVEEVGSTTSSKNKSKITPVVLRKDNSDKSKVPDKRTPKDVFRLASGKFDETLALTRRLEEIKNDASLENGGKKFRLENVGKYFSVKPLDQPEDSKWNDPSSVEASFLKSLAKYYVDNNSDDDSLAAFARTGSYVPKFWKYQADSLNAIEKAAKKVSSQVLTVARQRAEIFKLWDLIQPNWNTQLCNNKSGDRDSNSKTISFHRTMISNDSTSDGQYLTTAYTTHGEKGSETFQSLVYRGSGTDSNGEPIGNEDWVKYPSESTTSSVQARKPSLKSSKKSIKRKDEQSTLSGGSAEDFGGSILKSDTSAEDQLTYINRNYPERWDTEVTLAIDDDYEAQSFTLNKKDLIDLGSGLDMPHVDHDFVGFHEMPIRSQTVSNLVHSNSEVLSTGNSESIRAVEQLSTGFPTPSDDLVKTGAASATSSSTEEALKTVYLCGFQPADGTSGLGDTVLVIDDGPFKTFVNQIGDGFLEISAPLSLEKPAEVSHSDAWFSSVCGDQNMLGISSMLLTGSKNASVTGNATIARISVSLSVNHGSSNQYSMTFSSDAGGPNSNFSQEFNMLTLWLDSKSPPITLGYLLDSSKGLCNYALDYLPGLKDLASITLELIPPSDSRNVGSSLTFRSDSMSTTWLRLRFNVPLSDNSPSNEVYNKILTTLKNAFPFLAVGAEGVEKPFIINSMVVEVLRKMSMSYSAPIMHDEISLEISLIIDPKPGLDIRVKVYIEFNGTLMKLVLVPESTSTQYTKFLSNIASSSGGGVGSSEFQPDNILGGILESVPTSSVTFDCLQVSLSAVPSLDPKANMLQQVEAKFAIKFCDAVFLSTVSWSQGNNINFTSGLWQGSSGQGRDATRRLVPFIHDYDEAFLKSTILDSVGSIYDGVDNSLKFTDLLKMDTNSNAITMPRSLGVYSKVNILTVNVTRSGSGDSAEATFLFRGQISSDPDDEDDDEDANSKELSKAQPLNSPKLDLGTLNISFRYQKMGQANVTKEFILESHIYLVPRLITIGSPVVTLDLALEYNTSSTSDNTTWNVTGSVTDLQFSALFDLFDVDSQSAVMDFMEDLFIPSMWIEWNHTSNPAVVSLSAGGAIVVGLFELEFSYIYGKNTELASGTSHSNWIFKASLGSSVPSTAESPSLGDLIASLPGGDEIGDEINSLPFISNITIPPATVEDDADPPIQFCITKAPGSETIMWFMLAITSEIGTLSFTYVQLQAKRDDTTKSADGSTKSPPKGYKRVVRVMLDRLPSLPKIPIVGDIEQPFDSIDYVFVSDNTTQADSDTKLGLSTEELDLINSTMTAANQIPYRKTVSNLQSSSPGSETASNTSKAASVPILAAGHHFILSADGKVLIDHLFNSSSVPQTKSTASDSEAPDTGTDSNPDATPDEKVVLPTADSGATMGPLNRQASGNKPLSISNIGLQCKGGYLYILLDATVSLGPIQLSLNGLGLGIPLANLEDLSKGPNKIDYTNLQLIISGMSVSFNRPPVMLAGSFIWFKDDPNEGYLGGITVSILPYTLLAVGEYENNTKTKTKSVFVFASLNGPLLTLEFAEITDVALGFGYNYSLRAPGFDEVFDFPLVQAAMTPQTQTVSPMESLKGFTRFNSPAEDSMWFALGAKIDAFEIISIDAVIIFQFSPSDFVATMIGVTEITMPPNAPRRDCFVFAQLGIVSTIDPGQGTLMVGGRLSPNSFLLYPDCHLTGAFVLRYWFAPSSHAGDWVFSIGGFHPAYHPPDHYGPAPERVGISWDLNNSLSIRGGAFFAITPQLCMGGGNLKSVFSSGPIFAQFEAWASFIMNFKPFFFKGEMGIAITVGFHMDLWIIHISFHGEISGTLHLSGPEFGGTVYVDSKIHRFSIDFGSQDNTPNPLAWDEFLSTVMQQRGASVMDGGDSNAVLVVAIEQGAASEKIVSSKRKTGDEWFVRAGTFRFRVESKVPFKVENDNTTSKTLVIRGGQARTNRNPPVDWHLDQTSEEPTALKPLEDTKIYARLMGSTRGTTELLSGLTITIRYEHSVDKDSKPFRVVPITRKMPNALWSQYKRHEDPISSSDNNIGSLLSPSSNDATTEHLVGFHVDGPEPALPEKFEKIPAMNIMAMMSEGVFHGPTPGVASGESSSPKQKSKTQRTLLPPAQDGDEPDDRPMLPITAPNQTKFMPKNRTSDQWTQVISAWGSKSDTGYQQDLCDAWIKLCGWSLPITGSDYHPLMPTKPAMILNPPSNTTELENFANYYLAAPLLSDYA